VTLTVLTRSTVQPVRLVRRGFVGLLFLGQVWVMGGDDVVRYLTEVLLPGAGFVRCPEAVYAGVRLIPTARP
jgi:hypothetical protein